MKLDCIRIILVETSHPGNIGSAARAMKAMGIHQLYLVKPKLFPHPKAIELAAGAQDILDNAIITKTLEEALIGSQLAFGTSARTRQLTLPVVTPSEGALIVNQCEAMEIAFVFGREHAGLTNEELMHCHHHIHIPSNPEFSSLNLSQAVQIICYELRCRLTQNEIKKTSTTEFASIDEVEQFYQHLQQVLIQIDFLKPTQPKKLMQRLRRLYNRAKLESREVNILRGMLTKVQRGLK